MDFSSAITFLTDASNKISSKAVFVISVLLLIIVIDNTLSFSYYYNVSNKTKQLNEISLLLKDSTLNDSEIEIISQIKKDVLNHTTLKDRAYKYLTNIEFNSSEEDKISEVITDKRNPVIHFITSSWWLLSMGAILLVIFLGMMLRQKTLVDVLSPLIGAVFFVGFCYLLALVLSKLFSFIPLLFNMPAINYVLNFVLSSLCAWLFFKLIRILNKPSTSTKT